MYKKLLLLVLALMFMVFSNLRVCCRLTVDGEAVPGSFSPVSADIAVTVAERAAEEILPGFADMPDTERHYMLSLSRPDGSRAELADALLRSTPGVTVNSAVYVGGVRLGNVPDSAEFQTGLNSYIRNTMPTRAVNGYLSRGVEFRTQYSRTGSETNEDDMILLVTGMAPVLYSDGSGYVSMA